MKFHWFAEVTYDDLPADFPQKHHSAWVDTPTQLVDSKRIGEIYRMFIRLMTQADALGFDGLAVNEHHQTAFAMTPSPNLLAASLASNTENAAILVIGDSLALYNPPIRVAEEMAYLDCLSDGRLIAGFVFGTPMDSVFSYGNPPVELRERFHEARKLILRAWETEEPFAHNGKYTQLRYVNPWPRPIQTPPPIWVPGAGSVETWDLVIDENYCYGHLSFSGLQSAKPIVDGFWDYVDKRGGETNPNRMAFTQICCVAETDAQAERDYYEAVKYFYTHNPVAPGFISPPGYQTQDSLKAAIERGEEVVVGVNRYQPEHDEPVDILDIDNTAVRAQQIERLAKVRADRDESLCQTALAALTTSAESGEGNLLALSIEAMRALWTTEPAEYHGTIIDFPPVRCSPKPTQKDGIPVLVDGSQAAYHMAVDVQAIACDFYVVTGHKLYGPTGIGALYGQRRWLEAMPPYQGGGDMISSVTFERTTYNDVPHKFEAGTPHIAGAIGLGAAVDFIRGVGFEAIASHERRLLDYATDALSAVPGLRLIGTARNKASILSFVLDGVHAHDIGTIVDTEGVAIRTGHHCTQPVMDRFGVPATARASLAMYNTVQEIDQLVAALSKVREIFG